MLINLRVKTLDAQTHDFSIDNELTIREFKDKIAEKTNIAADQQRIIYCGRVLADEKQLKEYDVDGKVVHVAERPPPSQRGTSTSNSSSNDTPNTRERSNNRGGMRNSPLFRALDGMVLGTMAIPMNAAQNNGQQPNPFAASSSFSMNRITVARHMLDCANNIAAYLEDPERGLNNTSLDILARGSWTMESTVVEVGFTAADIPQNQNIVEMVSDAVSAALRRNNNTNVTVVQLPTVFGSNEGGEAGAANSTITAGATNMDTNDSGGSAVNDADSAAVIIEDVIDDAYDSVGANISVSSDLSATETANNTNSSPNLTTPDTSAADTSNTSTTQGTNTDENPSRRRTNTRVLAEVVDQMRTVQIRLNPFIQQFYELLNNDPTFEEEQTTERENAQRLYNRVSEALHYMSHAQHAISDLMLDISQPAPRFLTCRPILVEQSGYVSSNNYLSAAAAAAAAAAATGGNNNAQQRPRGRTYITPRYIHPPAINGNANATTPGNAPAAAATNNGNDTNRNENDRNNSTNSSANASGASSIEDPVDDPLTTPSTPIIVGAANAATQSNDDNTIMLRPRHGLYFGNNAQVQMSRLIQAMVNSAPINTELHVQILPPTIVSLPVNARANNGNNERAQAGGTAASGTASNNSIENNSANNNATENNSGSSSSSSSGNADATNNTNNDRNASNNATPARGTGLAANVVHRPVSASLAIGTLPTTSTQTRSTSRPQLQIGGLPAGGWNGRFIPANMVSSFDRFLPCNSHHIRESENGSGSNAATPGANTNTNNATPQIITSNTINPRSLRSLADLLPRVRSTPTVAGSGAQPTSTPRTGTDSTAPPSATLTPRLPGGNFFSLRNLLPGTANRNAAPSSSSSQQTPSSPTATTTEPSNNTSNNNTDTYRRNLHTQLLNFVNQSLFGGGPINDETVPPAINRAVDWFGESFLLMPQYEKPEYDLRHSVVNILRHMLPLFIEIVRDEQSNPAAFEERMKKICEDFVKRLYSVLNVCVGGSNAELYWAHLMRLLWVPTRSYFQDEALRFLSIYINTVIPSTTDTADAQQFIVHRKVDSIKSALDTPLETDVEMVEVASTSEAKPQGQFIIDLDDDDDVEIELLPAETLPSVTPGTEPWHRNIPNDWLPIIARDLRTQSENPPNQTPFSDAYISGMSAKRRKMIQNDRPPTDVNTLIARSVRKAIQTVGSRASTTAAAVIDDRTAEEITDAIANDAAVHASYTEAVRLNVRERLKKDSDYKADKYPHATKFINK
ncbi:large proline-rich protein BAG6 isoform X2 [Eurosta solidaginis]|uniref:large proline-rich protein BAG6 isoform X2 n=1 Tax=Eurosta solidaginis TaxID=178769 RepID=UPI003530B4AD